MEAPCSSPSRTIPSPSVVTLIRLVAWKLSRRRGQWWINSIKSKAGRSVKYQSVRFESSPGLSDSAQSPVGLKECRSSLKKGQKGAILGNAYSSASTGYPMNWNALCVITPQHQNHEITEADEPWRNDLTTKFRSGTPPTHLSRALPSAVVETTPSAPLSKVNHVETTHALERLHEDKD